MNALKYLNLLSQSYPNMEETSAEIINLQAILNLPKGTEEFISDLHGEYESFLHIMKNASGVIRNKIDDTFGNAITEEQRRTLATLIYYPEEKLELLKEESENLEDLYKVTLYRLVEVCRGISVKYTRSKVRKALPKNFAYIIDELLNLQETPAKDDYYAAIIDNIIRLDQSDSLIIALSYLIQRLAVDTLHIIGDIYDRGAGAHIIMDSLMQRNSIDIQWGNHDIVWMGAASGNLACIAAVIRMAARYNTLNTLEEGYGINMRHLESFAINTYDDSDCHYFMPVSGKDLLTAKIHKAICIIGLKLEGQLLKRHPEYQSNHQLLLDKINWENGTVSIEGREYPLTDQSFPTVNPAQPYTLTAEEQYLIEKLKKSFLQSEKLQKHVQFLYSVGSIYKIFNSNLLFHGCIPMEEDGSFADCMGYRGKAYLDYCDAMARKGYFGKPRSKAKADGEDFLWYLAYGTHSPLFGKENYSLFTKYFVDGAQPDCINPYYTLVEEEKVCNQILSEFHLPPEKSHIINGNAPIKSEKGKRPIRANGKLFVIDGGLSKAYQTESGIAGYTLVYNSYGLVLTSHQPFESRKKAIEEDIDIHSTSIVVEKVLARKDVADTDTGARLKEKISDLELLMHAYKSGTIVEH
jgi:fructose-1,6-bisphosphatase-3